MPRKRGKQEKGGTDPSHTPTTPPQARIHAASPPATPAPKRIKTVTRVTGAGWETVEEVEVPKTKDEIDKEWIGILAEETKKGEVAQRNLAAIGEEIERMVVK